MALERAAALGCTAVQLFTHSTVQWRMAPLADDETKRFRDLNAAIGPFALAAHASYLINLASPERTLRERSIRAMITEMERCEVLGIPLLVFHPGAHMGAGEGWGLRRVAGALNRIHRATRGMKVSSVIEITAGQGTGLGWRLEQITRVLDGLKEPDRSRVCFDTAHAFAAGYDFRSRESYEMLWREFDRTIGIGRLGIFHLNDSAKPLGSRVDRHAHIGRGAIGAAPFGWILADRRFGELPKVIETPKEGGMDRKNLSLLRRLARKSGVLALGILMGVVLSLPMGCAREDRWWGAVTGVPGDTLGFEDRWEATVQGKGGAMLEAHVCSAELARLDFSLEAGGYSVVFNHGRTVRVHPAPPREMLVDRTLLLTYMLPFMGRQRLGEALVALGIDSAQVAYGVEWEGHVCIRIGGAGSSSAGGDSTPASGGQAPAVPAIYFDEETGAVLRLITVSNSPVGRRVGEFRLFGHQERRGAYLATRLETWSRKGLRSTLTRVSAEDGVTLPITLFEIPRALEEVS